MAARTLKPERVLFGSVGLISLAVILVLAFTLRDSQRGPADPNWERIQTEGQIRIGVDPSLTPFGMFAEDGALLGFDVALGEELAAALGLRVQFLPLGFDGLYDSLLLGEVDLVIAALRPDPLRLDRVIYTPPYFDAGQVLVSYEADLDHLSALENEILGVEFASEGDLAAQQIEGLNIERFFSAEEALQALEDDQIQAALIDHVSALFYPDSDLFISAPLIPDPYVMSIRRSDWRLHRQISETLTHLDQNGTLAALIEEWFGRN